MSKYTKKTIYTDKPNNITNLEWQNMFLDHFNLELNKSKDLPNNVCNGKLIRLSVEDANNCFYEITKINKSEAVLVLRNDMCPDLCSDQVLQEGGSFGVSFIGRMVNNFV